MNLFEVADDAFKVHFGEPARNPQQDLDNIARREKAINHELRLVHDAYETILKRVVGQVVGQDWNADDPANPQQADAIAQKSQSLLPIVRTTKDGAKRIVNWIAKVPQNEELVPKIQYLMDRKVKVEEMRRELPALERKARNRLSTWKRKQPNYVSRNTGKELLDEIKKKLEDFIADKQLGVTIGNNYYWAKNKMIVIEIPVRISAPGMTVNQTAKQSIKPYINSFLEELGYNQFRFSERYIDSQLTMLKIQLDDVEAKNKAKEDAVS